MNTVIEIPFPVLAGLVIALCFCLSWAWVECCIIAHLTRKPDDVFPLKKEHRS